MYKAQINITVITSSSFHAFPGLASIAYDIIFIGETGGSGDFSLFNGSEKLWKYNCISTIPTRSPVVKLRYSVFPDAYKNISNRKTIIKRKISDTLVALVFPLYDESNNLLRVSYFTKKNTKNLMSE